MNFITKKRLRPTYRFQRDVRIELFAIIVGFTGGIAGFLFRTSIEIIDEALFGDHGLIIFVKNSVGNLAAVILTIMIPTLGGLVVGYAIWKSFPLAKGHGIPNVLEAMHNHDPIYPKTPIGKFILSILTIGAGLSAGSEGPIAQIGAGAGSYLGRKYRFSPAETNILIAAGAGAGIAAVFNAPLGGTLFALEVLMVSISLHAVIPIAIACIVAVTLNYVILGNLQSVFNIPIYELESIVEFPLVFFLGILIGFIAIFWQKTLSYSERYFEKNRFDIPIDTAISGFIVGCILVIFTVNLRGPGYPIIHIVLGAEFEELITYVGLALGFFLIGLCFLKIATTALSLGAGVSGGIFAPSLFMGATFGAGYAIILNTLFDLDLNVGLYALLGLAALFAAAARAPLTMIVITLEMSGDMKIIPPMMLIVLVSFLVHLILVNESIYTERIIHKGISSTARTVDEIMNYVTMDEVMTRETIAILESTLTNDLLDIFLCYKHMGYPVVDNNGNLKGMITMFDLRKVRAQHLAVGDMKVGDLMTKQEKLIVAYPSTTVREATDLIHRYVIGRLPVVIKTGDELKLIGIFTRTDIIQTIESFQGFLEVDRNRVKSSYEKEVENLMIDIIPSEYHHLRDKVVVVSRDIISEAEDYIKHRTGK